VEHYEGYSIHPVKEQTMGPQGDPREKPISVTTYSVHFGKKVVAAGLPDIATAKRVIDTRRKLRTRMGRDPEG
jgi:hypothetical protein